MADVQTLEDYRLIRDLIERYSTTLTRRAWDEMGELYHLDAVWEIGPPYTDSLQTRQGIRDGIAGSMAGFDTFVQMTHSVNIELDGDRATSVTVVHEVGSQKSSGSKVWAMGLYRDVITRVDGHWGFSRRYYECLDTEMSGPLFDRYR